MKPPVTPPPGPLAHLPILVTVALWGFQLPAVHVLAERWDIASLNITRYLIAAAAFVVLLRLSGGAVPRPLALLPGLGLGALFAGFGLLYTIGAAVGDPILLVTAMALMPVTASLVTWIATGRPPERALLVALVPAVPGAILATPEPVPGGETGFHPALGFALILAAQACWSVYSLTVPRLLPETGPLGRTRLSVFWSLPYHIAVFAGAAALGAVETAAEPALTGDVLLIGVVALGPLVLGVLFWNRSVERLGLPLCALYLNLVPVVGVAIAAGFGDTPSRTQILGIALVVAGMVLAQLHRRDGSHRPRAPRV